MWSLKQSITKDTEWVDTETGVIHKYNRVTHALDKATIIRSEGKLKMDEIIKCRPITATGVVTSVVGGAVAAKALASGVITGVCLFTAGFIITDMTFPYNKLYNFKLKK